MDIATSLIAQTAAKKTKDEGTTSVALLDARNEPEVFEAGVSLNLLPHEGRRPGGNMASTILMAQRQMGNHAASRFTRLVFEKEHGGFERESNEAGEPVDDDSSRLAKSEPPPPKLRTHTSGTEYRLSKSVFAGQPRTSSAEGYQLVQRKVKKISYSEGDAERIDVAIFELGGLSIVDHVQNHVNRMSTLIQNMYRNHKAGIDVFVQEMRIAQDTKATGYGEVFKKGALKAISSKLIDSMGAVPYVGPVIKLAADALQAQLEQNKTAEENRSISEFCSQLTLDLPNGYNKAASDLHTKGFKMLWDQVNNAKGMVNGRRVFGDKATVLKGMAHGLDMFEKAIPNPRQFLDAIVTSWITDFTAGGRGAKTFALGRQMTNGTIRVWIRSEIRRDGGVALEVEKVTLNTETRQDQAAQLVMKSLRTGRKTLWNCGIPVILMWQGPNTVGGTKTYQAEVEHKHKLSSMEKPPNEASERVLESILLSGELWKQMEDTAKRELEGE